MKKLWSGISFSGGFSIMHVGIQLGMYNVYICWSQIRQVGHRWVVDQACRGLPSGMSVSDNNNIFVNAKISLTEKVTTYNQIIII